MAEYTSLAIGTLSGFIAFVSTVIYMKSKSHQDRKADNKDMKSLRNQTAEKGMR